MFFDSGAWPPAPDGYGPPPPEPRLTPVQERILLRVIGILLVTLFMAPFAGSSLINVVVAVLRAIF